MSAKRCLGPTVKGDVAILLKRRNFNKWECRFKIIKTGLSGCNGPDRPIEPVVPQGVGQPSAA